MTSLALDDTLAQSDSIIVGTVVGKVSRWGDASKRWMQTDVSLSVDEVLYGSEKGAAIGKTVRLTYWGGTIDGETQEVADLRVPAPGERIVAFLHGRWDGGTTMAPTVGFNQGLFLVATDGGKTIVSDANGQQIARMLGGQLTRGMGAAGATGVDLAAFGAWVRANIQAIKNRPPPKAPAGPDSNDPRVLKTFELKSELERTPSVDHPTQVAMSRAPGTGPSAASAAGVPQGAPPAVGSPESLLGELVSPSALRPDRVTPKWGTAHQAHLPIVVNNFPDAFTPWSPEDEYQMSKWNYYAHDVFHVFVTPTGTYGWPNDRFDLAGWPSESSISSVYGSTWYCGSGCITLGVCFKRYDGLGWIIEADIALNPAASWTLDDEWVFDGSSAYGFRQTMIHEMGHMHGLNHDFTQMALMNYFQPSNYRHYAFPFTDDALGIRFEYSANANAVTDLGVYLYYETRSCYDGTTFYDCLDQATFPATVTRGGSFVVNQYRVENVGTTTIGTPTIQWYLTQARNYVSAYYGLGTTTYPSLALGYHFTESTVGRTLTVGGGVPVGLYYLAAYVPSDGGPGQGSFPFSNNYAFSETRIKVVTDTTTSLTSSADPSLLGQSVSFTATVSGSSPSGTVRFADGGTTLPGCSAVTLSGGHAACVASGLGVGTHGITAAYFGDTYNNASTSLSYLQVVKTSGGAGNKRRDYNSDGKSDLVWRSTGGATAMWLMNGMGASLSAIIYANPDWSVTHTGDLSGDGKSDLIWRNSTTGMTSAWLMNGASMASGATLLADRAWSVTRVADFNGDGKDDLVWRNSLTGQTAIWLMNGLAATSSSVIFAESAWQVLLVGDFNGDGKADILWRNSVSGSTAIWLMNGTSILSSAVILTDPTWEAVKVGDFNGDGKSDIVWRNASSGQTAMWLMNGLSATTAAVIFTDPAWVASLVGDFDGNGKSDLVWHNSATGATAIWLMNGTVTASAAVIFTDPNWSVSHTTDTNGDNKYDLVWRNTASGNTALWLMNGLSFTASGVILGDPAWAVAPAEGF